jgi:hypothetical protein
MSSHYERLSKTCPQARRRYQCDLCLGWIEPGERHCRIVAINDGEFECRRSHSACDALYHAAMHETGTINDDEWPGDFGALLAWCGEELTPETRADVRRVWDGDGAKEE